MNLLITGGCGFIGRHFVRHALDRWPACRVVNLDALTYAADPAALADLEGSPRYRFVRGDVTDAPLVRELVHGGIDAIVHCAAESHVDRAIRAPAPFIRTNITGTYTLLEAAREAGVQRFLHVSTDEVYGAAAPGCRFPEGAPLAPGNPYAAAKAAADLLALAYGHTYGLPVLITRCTNNYGPGQHPEKFIPTCIHRAHAGQPVPLYGDGLQVRDWLHVQDHCAALARVLEAGTPGEVYHVAAGEEHTNLEVARAVLDLLGRPPSLLAHVPDRPGHDRRYALDSRKLATRLNWAPAVPFARGLAETVRWYVTRLEAREGPADADQHHHPGA